MKFRKAVKSDFGSIMEIIGDAQSFLKSQGVDQWQDGYPEESLIMSDIESGESYVIEVDGRVDATAVISFKGERTYDDIYDGKWLTYGQYAVIHRIASRAEARKHGLSAEIMKSAEKLCRERNVKSIKIDTHEENIPMQNFLNKNGFKYCGIIYIENGDKRIAFEKVLK